MFELEMSEVDKGTSGGMRIFGGKELALAQIRTTVRVRGNRQGSARLILTPSHAYPHEGMHPMPI